MKPFRQRSLAFVSGLAMVFASFGTVPATAERDPYETPIIPVGPTDPNVVFDKNTGVLTLKGKIDKEDVRAYAGNDEVESVIAEDTAVFPADCSELFRLGDIEDADFKGEGRHLCRHRYELDVP